MPCNFVNVALAWKTNVCYILFFCRFNKVRKQHHIFANLYIYFENLYIIRLDFFENSIFCYIIP